jgi:RNA polymerase nonessential primary-like sigma factor
MSFLFGIDLAAAQRQPPTDHANRHLSKDASAGFRVLSPAAAEQPAQSKCRHLPRPTKQHKSIDNTQALDATRLYLNEIGTSPLLSPQEELHFARLAQQGDPQGRKRMIESNLRLVVKIARGYFNRGLSLLDLIEEGNLGLIHAVDKFDPELGYRFSTYATWWIREAIEKAVISQTRTIRLPIQVARKLNTYLRAVRELTRKLDHEPSIIEIAKLLEKTVDEVEHIRGLNIRVSSLDTTLGPESDKPLVDTLAGDQPSDPCELLQNTELTQSIKELLSELSDKQCEVVVRRFGLRGDEGCTLEEVGQRFDLTRERVRQIQTEALKRLRTVLENHGLSSTAMLQ